MKTLILLLIGLLIVGAPGMVGTPIEQAIATIRAVGPEGQGNEAAGKAWKTLAGAGISAVIPVLESMDGANLLALNWLRSAVESIVAKQRGAGGALPLAELGEFLLDTKHEPKARTLAFELIATADPSTGEALIPGMLNDPDVTLRREAVQRLISEAKRTEEAKSAGAAALLFRQALGAARDVDQIETIVERLRDLGREVDLPEHFGFLMHWKVIGPFDNTGREGFAKVYPPENGIDMEAAFDGKDGEVRWGDLITADEYGMVDINKPYGMLKEAVAYTYTEFNSETSQPVELRLGCKNAWKVWLNGELLFERDEYHRGIRIDQYRMPAQLNVGKNTILVKICQDAQTQDWTVEWQFQLRVCDATGTAVLAKDRPPTPVAQGPVDLRRGKKEN